MPRLSIVSGCDPSCVRAENDLLCLMWYLGRIACVSPTGRTAFFIYLRAEANGSIASALVGSSPQTPAAHICNTLLSIFPPSRSRRVSRTTALSFIATIGHAAKANLVLYMPSPW